MSTTNANDNYAPMSRSHYYSSPPLTIVVVIVILFILFSVFFALYFYKCFLQNILQSRQHLRSSSPSDIVAANPSDENPGLDPKVLKTFPTCTYSAVKQYRKPKYGLECAICLLEFEDDHVLRLITICSHVFHQECIDLWFKMQKTCPACRQNLEFLAGEGTPARDLCSTYEGTPAGDAKRDSVSITIKDEEKKGKFSGEMGESFSRSKTTGHSIFISRDIDEDRFTLRLPDHVTEELTKANHWPKHLYKSGSFGRKANIHGQGPDDNV